MSDSPRILVVLPGLPDRRAGGGVVLYELLAWLVDRAGRNGAVAVVLPVHDRLRAAFERIRADTGLDGVQWHPLVERRSPGLRGYLTRAIGTLPSDVAKVATEENRATLERLRREFRPTVELAVSSWALAAYRGLAFHEAVRLFMVNVDPAIVWQAMPAVWTPGAVARAVVRKIACAIDRPKVRRLCQGALETAERVGSISPTDVAALNALGGRKDVAYLPPLMRPRPVDRSRAVPGTVLVTTNFSYSPNVESLRWFLREVWPRVDATARLTVAGLDDGGHLAALCRRRERVTYVGCLDPRQLDDAFASSAVAVNPTILGSGFQVKLIDAVARSVPVVSTAFSNKLGPAIPSSDDPAELAALISARLGPDTSPPIDYASFHRQAVEAWENFLFDRAGDA